MDEAAVATRRHTWVSMKFVEVEPVGLDVAGDPAIFHVGEPDERVACTTCLTGLTARNMTSECPGEPSE